jgi:hypothetical protein
MIRFVLALPGRIISFGNDRTPQRFDLAASVVLTDTLDDLGCSVLEAANERAVEASRDLFHGAALGFFLPGVRGAREVAHFIA